MIDQVRQFIEAQVIPLEGEFLRKPFRTLLPELNALREKVKAMGLFTPYLAREHGGAGLSLREFALMSEQLGRTPIGHYVFNCQAPDVGNIEILAAHGTAVQKRHYLDPLVRGDIRSCFAMTEPEFAGSNPTQMATTAVKDGSDYVINGHKWFASAADGAKFAVVMAVTDPNAKRHERASQILVPCDTPGFELVRNIPVMGEAGCDWASHAELRFTDCRVPLTNRLGEEGRGFALAQERLGPGRIHHCMRWLGICDRAFDLMCRHAATREVAPRVMLGSKQAIQHWIAESRAEIASARLLVLQTAEAIDTAGASNVRDEISLIKFHTAGVLMRVLDRAIQTHGALGMTDDIVLGYWYRHERAARIYDGADEVHKSAVARRILRRYGLQTEI